ncbi:D-alanine--D-alanine ligase [Pseudomonadota bacterium]
MNKQTIAVFFGGMAPEHDVSIITGIQAMYAIDSTKYDFFPVYIDQKGNWWTGSPLLDKRSYHFSEKAKKRRLRQVKLPVGQFFDHNNRSYLREVGCVFKGRKLYFDVALLAFHGCVGEDGLIQGALDSVGATYTGCRPLASSIFMNKKITKDTARKEGINVLDELIIKQSKKGKTDIKKILKDMPFKFPICVKPCNLGSSVGVYKVTKKESLENIILELFELDNEIIIEPFVENLVEYNVSVLRDSSGVIKFSAIEKPFRKGGEFLNFKEKYMSGGKAGGKLESKLFMPISEGMASATREFNPKLSTKQKNSIIEGASKIFEAVNGNGAPRIDFLSDKKTGEIWFNEVNPIPGSLAYYLWEMGDKKNKMSFSELVDRLIQEAFEERNKVKRDFDLSNTKSSIFDNA